MEIVCDRKYEYGTCAPEFDVKTRDTDYFSIITLRPLCYVMFSTFLDAIFQYEEEDIASFLVRDILLVVRQWHKVARGIFASTPLLHQCLLIV